MILVVLPSPTQAQKLPPAIAAAANPVNDGQALIKQKKYPEALAKFGEAEGAANAIPQLGLRLFYQITARLGSATALDGMQRYDAALEHCDWANQTLATPAARQIPIALSAAAHHMCGVILYHLKRIDEAKGFFEQAAKEGDKTAADWEKALNAPPAPTKPAELIEAADNAAQGGKLNEALQLYALALRQADQLGDKTGDVMDRALAVALRMDSPPIPEGAKARLGVADAALASGVPSRLEDARDLMTETVIEAPWWGDGWRRLADIEEKLADLKGTRGALRYYLKATPKAPDQGAIEQRIANLGQRIETGGAGAPSGGAATSTVPAAAARAPTPPALPLVSAVSDLGGHWAEGDGRIVTVMQNGNQVSWSSCCEKGHEDLVLSVSATFDGKNLTGLLHWRDGGKEGNGTASYTLKGDKQLEGELVFQGRNEPYHSVLTRQTEKSLAGAWKLDDGQSIEIKQTGTQVSWSIQGASGHETRVGTVTCNFDGKELVGTYQYTEGNVQGLGTVHLVFDGNRLDGSFVPLSPPGQQSHIVFTRP